MDNQNNRWIAVSYRLYTNGDKGRELVEQTTSGQPFRFISGFGYALDAFEKQIVGKAAGEDFSFTLQQEEAYGPYDQERVLELDREMFTIDGKFDGEHVYPEAMIPLQNEEGTRFYGRVLEITPHQVKVDLNHPLAGEQLHFEGTVLENRDATQEEINALIARLTGGGCSGCQGKDNGNCNCGDGCQGGCDGGY